MIHSCFPNFVQETAAARSNPCKSYFAACWPYIEPIQRRVFYQDRSMDMTVVGLLSHNNGGCSHYLCVPSAFLTVACVSNSEFDSLEDLLLWVS